MTNNNLPPTNIEAEEAILGSILFDPSAISIAAPILPIEAFYVAAINRYTRQQASSNVRYQRQWRHRAGHGLRVVVVSR